MFTVDEKSGTITPMDPIAVERIRAYPVTRAQR